MSLSGNPRRSTLAMSGRPSTYGRQSIGLAPQITKDPRPIKDKRWQAASAQKLIQYLVQSGYPNPISAKTFSSPSSKDFQMIFKFLYAQLDPYYEFQKKFEEEVPVIIKGLNRVTSRMADFIGDACLDVGTYLGSPLLTLCVDQIDEEPIEAEKELSEAEEAESIFLEYLTKAYKLWLNGANDFEAIDKTLLQNFEEKDRKLKREIDTLKANYKILENEYLSLSQSESPLSIIQREKTILESDKEKFNSYIEHVQSKLKKLEDNLISLQEEYQTSGPLLLILEQTVKSLTAERANLTAQVEAQEISASDVDRMNAERDQLAKSVTIVCDQLDQVNKAVWNKEISIQKRMDTLERLVENFNTLLYQLDLLGNDIARYSCMSEELELYIQESQPEKMVSINLRREAKPAVNALIESFRDTYHKTSDELILLQEKLDILGWNVVKKEEQVSLLESKIKSVNETYILEKNVIGQTLAQATKEMEELEKSIQTMKSETGKNSITSQQKYAKTKRVYDDAIKRLNHERDQLLAHIVKSMTSAFTFEQAISLGMEELQKLAFEADQNVNIPH